MKTAAGSGLAARVLLAQVVIGVAGAATVWLIVSAIGPAIFQSRLGRIAGVAAAENSRQLEEAFRSASSISVTIALLISLGAGLAVSAHLSRRLAAPVTRLATAAGAVAGGRHDTRAADPAMGAEFTALTAAVNAMAQRLESVEPTRRPSLADLAQEMRTLVATLEAYLEALEDGVVSTDTETWAVLRAQIGRLARLADDVTAVSQAEER